MSILTDAVGGIWKVGAIAALVLAAGAAGGWALAAHDGNVVRADLAAERKVTGELKTSIHDQNIAVAGLAAATAEAERRRLAAETAAKPAIAQAAARATAVYASTAPDCAGVLNEAWEGWK
ncbi:MAG: hypothetical protein M3Y65_15470 [Pseudomonadota bacterium]|nr:hypothetical protein [Pseudomonadota bacterium]